MSNFVVLPHKAHTPAPMLREHKALKLIEIFITCDDFCNTLTHWQTQQGKSTTTRSGQLIDRELLTLTIFYHYSGAKCFEYYYRHCVEMQLRSYFPQLITYERFMAKMPRLLPGLYVLLKWQCSQAKRTGFYIADSKPLAVCDRAADRNHRIKANKVFAGLAARGKSSMGWFYGFEAHLVINQYGKLVNFVLPP